jgi:hypothetical protein
MTEVLQSGVDDADILDVQLGRDRSHPVEPAPMRVDERERSLRERGRQREPRQARAWTDVYPMLPWPRGANRRQAEGVIDVPLAKSFGLTRPKKAKIDGFAVRALELPKGLLGSWVSHPGGSWLSLGGLWCGAVLM